MSVRRLLALTHHLPPESATAYVLEPLARDWPAERELLAQIVEELSMQIVLFIKANTEKTPAGLEPVRIPRPGELAAIRAGDDPEPPAPAMSSPAAISAFLRSASGSVRVTPRGRAEDEKA